MGIPVTVWLVVAGAVVIIGALLFFRSRRTTEDEV
jgi:LPXTG-motif cell wall-anchored protein